jgi:saccharopine dehydrogenase-like NADP-dependent oxidoreductase/ATP-dependent Clp protease adapter protein ClpS
MSIVTNFCKLSMLLVRSLAAVVLCACLCVGPSEQFQAIMPPRVRMLLPRCDRRAQPILVRRSAPGAPGRVPPAMRDGDSLVDKGLDLLLGRGLEMSAGVRSEGFNDDEHAEQFCVTVADDDENTVDSVVRVLRKATGSSWKTSLDNTLRIGRSGKAVVFRGSASACEQVESILLAQTPPLRARVEPSSVSELVPSVIFCLLWTVSPSSIATTRCGFSKFRHFVLTRSLDLQAENSPQAELEREAEARQQAGPKPIEEGKRWGDRVFRAGGTRPTVVFVGGTGRVGMWTIRELVRMTKGDLDVVIAGRKSAAAEKLMKQMRGDTFVTGGREWATMRTVLKGSCRFEQVDLADAASLQAAMAAADLVVHTAGPFQRGEPQVLRAAIATQTPYMDVCDDLGYSKKCKALNAEAVAAGTAAVTTCGIYPGLSNVMAAALVRKSFAETGETPHTLEFSYYTAGTGGVGGTILASTFLLISEDAEVIENGARVQRGALSLQKEVNFGAAIGKRRTMILNLPEAASAHEVLKVPNVSAFFGTAPDFWNLLLIALVKIVPASLLGDRDFAAKFAAVSLPVNRVVDAVVGSAAAIRVDVKDESNKIVRTALWTGRYLSQAVGVATAAMALALLEKPGLPGMLFRRPCHPESRRVCVALRV